MVRLARKVFRAVVDALVSPQARRYEAALLLIVYEAIRSAFGSP